ncbi:related to Protein-S-isoprenylcysteine O-methyltransferase [Saccharomycodes ludwigii]|uniref:Protein-S-isoprenylcysteine O-methyltransferase n=1 Tax=Saccharomycodes ludwigii TaxID=36035 RepID=A0A376BAS4_9ASCO|nr:hypothetical protein SCDLUD_003288 [Saccharomycodes ludwigii]KAH3900316.1 hypothetical protein SCDLUD_003288 [Saccharomycodes ludwigii]SSD61756.1 related to Protein-S-isoprenylcysteine O-methyltransferase [Saccharomycodes ludwigii]
MTKTASDSNSAEQHKEYQNDLPVIIDGKPYPDIKFNALDIISKTSFFLGILLGYSLGLLPRFKYTNLICYIIFLAIFHFLEFYLTSKFNPGKVNNDSFLLNNGTGYFYAHSLALAEFILEVWLTPSSWKLISFSTVNKIVFSLGLILVIFGQIVRSLALITCGKSFSHLVKRERLADHELVTKGIYSYSRHPSYCGFFWFAIGLEVICFNPISTVAFAIVLWNFFSHRISYEEKYLLEFFGEDYKLYKQNVGVGIPFIN